MKKRVRRKVTTRMSRYIALITLWGYLDARKQRLILTKLWQVVPTAQKRAAA